MPKRIFLCYSHKDQQFVVRLANDLNQAGLDVWIDRWRLKPGDQLVQAIGEGIGTSDYFLPVLTPSFLASRFAKRELDEALVYQLGEHGVKVVPVLAKTCEVPALLRSIMYADFSKSYIHGIENLARGLDVEIPSYPVTMLNETATLSILDDKDRFRVTHSHALEVQEPNIREFTDLHVFSDSPPENVRVNSGKPKVVSQTGLHRIITSLPKPLPTRSSVKRTISYEGVDQDNCWFYRLPSSFTWARVRVRFSPKRGRPKIFESHFDRDGFKGAAPQWRISRRNEWTIYSTALSPEMARWRTLMIQWRYG
ncbi:MAG: toll/interleukin-1 receptor domain-containing protein [Candidatus Thiodiazotropha endolucinida]